MQETAENAKTMNGNKIRQIMAYFLERPRLMAGLLALLAFGVATTSVLLTAWLNLHPCYLCIVQRSLSVLVAVFLALAVVTHARFCGPFSYALAGLLSLCGMVAAAFQSAEQWYPDNLSCTFTQPNILEKAVDWLGNYYPTLFMATGFCEDRELEIFKLSLANWSFLCFTVFALGAFWLLWGRLRKNRSPSTTTP